MIPVLFGLSGTTLSDAERALFRDADPAGFILFGRNVADPDQLRALTDNLRDMSGRSDLPILIDQEGGRVARLQPPHWPTFPAAAVFDRLYDMAPASAIAAARANAFALGLMLSQCGITVDCMPLLDLRQPGAHNVIGDRAFGSDPLRVAALGRAALEGLAEGGIIGVIKHLPGHGRVTADSHVSLPHVDVDEAALARDLAPFAAVADLARMAMTAHVVYSAWDAGHPATLSATVIDQIIRQRIGFDGLLMSDDIEMQALSGPVEQRAKAALGAGCDVVLHCSGNLAAMQQLASTLPPISDLARHRLDQAMLSQGNSLGADGLADAMARRDHLLALAA